MSRRDELIAKIRAKTPDSFWVNMPDSFWAKMPDSFWVNMPYSFWVNMPNSFWAKMILGDPPDSILESIFESFKSETETKLS